MGHTSYGMPYNILHARYHSGAITVMDENYAKNAGQAFFEILVPYVFCESRTTSVRKQLRGRK